jgi:hypothetical protein
MTNLVFTESSGPKRNVVAFTMAVFAGFGFCVCHTYFSGGWGRWQAGGTGLQNISNVLHGKNVVIYMPIVGLKEFFLPEVKDVAFLCLDSKSVNYDLVILAEA